MLKKSKGLLNFFIMLLFFFCLILFLYILYDFYQEIPREPINIEVNVPKSYENSTKNGIQFQPNMKFNHKNITYYIDPNCDENKKKRMKDAFRILSSESGVIRFDEVFSDYADIEVSCSNNYESDGEKDFFIAGEGGAKEIIKSGNYHVITKGVILLFDYPYRLAKCEYPNVELHELSHVLGFDHSNKKDSLMNPLLNSCSQRLDYEIIKEIRRLYSEEDLPDITFEDIKLVKSGRYLNMNLTIKNKGVIDVDSFNLSILDDENRVLEEKEIKNLKFGGGIILNIEFLRLKNPNTKKIMFFLDKENKIKELQKNNNFLEVRLI